MMEDLGDIGDDASFLPEVVNDDEVVENSKDIVATARRVAFPLTMENRGTADDGKIVPQRPTSAMPSRRPRSAAVGRTKHFVEGQSTSLVKRVTTDDTFADYLATRLKSAETRCDAAQTELKRERLFHFANSEKVFADKHRLLRALKVGARRAYGDKNRWASRQTFMTQQGEDELQVAKATSKVVNKVRCFYAELRAERAVLQKVTDGLKEQMRESLIKREQAEAHAAAAEAARVSAQTETQHVKDNARNIVMDATATMAAAAKASTAAVTEADRIRHELDDLRLQLKQANLSEEQARKSKLDILEETRLRIDAEAQRSRELAEFGARMQARVTGAEQETTNAQLRAELAEEKAARLESAGAVNIALASEVERLKALLINGGGSENNGPASPSSSTGKKHKHHLHKKKKKKVHIMGSHHHSSSSRRKSVKKKSPSKKKSLSSRTFSDNSTIASSKKTSRRSKSPPRSPSSRH